MSSARALNSLSVVEFAVEIRERWRFLKYRWSAAASLLRTPIGNYAGYQSLVGQSPRWPKACGGLREWLRHASTWGCDRPSKNSTWLQQASSVAATCFNRHSGWAICIVQQFSTVCFTALGVAERDSTLCSEYLDPANPHLSGRCEMKFQLESADRTRGESNSRVLS